MGNNIPLEEFEQFIIEPFKFSLETTLTYVMARNYELKHPEDYEVYKAFVEGEYTASQVVPFIRKQINECLAGLGELYNKITPEPDDVEESGNVLYHVKNISQVPDKQLIEALEKSKKTLGSIIKSYETARSVMVFGV